MKKVTVAALAALAGVLAAGSAKAEVSLFNVNEQMLDSSLAMRRSTTEQFSPIRGQSVADRARPDYDPVPIPVGSFQLFPAMNLGSYYDSNIYAQKTGALDEQVFKINPTVTLASNWGRHAFAITGLGDFNYYANNNEQDYHAGALQAEGRYDISTQTWLAAVAGYQRVAEMRGGPTTPGNSVGPSEFDLYTAGAEVYRGVGLLKAKANYDFSYYNYDPIELIGGGTANQSNRNRTQNKVSAQVGYDVTENLKPYVQGGYNWRSYTNGGFNSSNGYGFDVGAKMDFGGIVTTEAYIGYIAQDYVNYNNGDLSAIDFGADILWNVTNLTSIEGKAGRNFEETTSLGSPAILSTQGSVTVMHELRRDLVLNARGVYYALDFQNISRHDDVYEAGGGGRYYINRNLYTDLSYNYQSRQSEISANDFNRHVAFLRVGIQY